VTDPIPDLGGLRVGPAEATTAPAGRELFVRHARRDGRAIAVLRAVDHGSACIVEAEVYPLGSGAGGRGGTGVVRPGPYTFSSPHDATAFVTEAVEALMYLGCDISAD